MHISQFAFKDVEGKDVLEYMKTKKFVKLFWGDKPLEKWPPLKRPRKCDNI
jgi:hypothetical protein